MEELLMMGFDEKSARSALSRSGGNVERAIDYLLSGPHEEVSSTAQPQSRSHTGDSLITLDVSQYSYGGAGTSACTVIACSIVKHLLKELRSKRDVADKVALREVLWAGVQHYQTVLSSQDQLSVDELGSFMTDSLKALDGGPMQGLLDGSSRGRHWEEVFQNARNRANPAECIGIVITKPPETVCVILPPQVDPTGKAPQFIFFDSHSRPQLGLDGAYMALYSDEQGLVDRLNLTFTALPMELGGADNYLMQMYNMFEAFGFQCDESKI